MQAKQILSGTKADSVVPLVLIAAVNLIVFNQISLILMKSHVHLKLIPENQIPEEKRAGSR